MTALVRLVIALAMVSAFSSRSSSESTSTGLAPRCVTTFAVLQKVMLGTITSSPGPTPNTASERCRPDVQELTAMACRAPTSSAKACSNLATLGPLVSHPERSVSATSAISSSPMEGRQYGRNVFLAVVVTWEKGNEFGADERT